jgi:hypothetical protein
MSFSVFLRSDCASATGTAGAVIQLAAWSLVAAALTITPARAQTLRIAAYNIDADTPPSGGCSSPVGSGCPDGGPGLTDVLQAIGNEHLAGNAQPLDVLALEELDSAKTVPPTGTPSVTLDYLISQLNTIYPTANYKADTTVDPTTGGTGGGPSGLIYNANTVQLLGAGVIIGSASGSGAPRAPMRYELAPKGFNNHTADFYIYVSHMKAGSAGSGSGSNGDRRNIEATTIRTNAATLGANAHIIYAGDYNVDGSSEAAMQTMIAAGTGQAIDTLATPPRSPYPANYWDTTSTYQDLLTESATFLQYRDDFQMITSPMLIQPGMQLLSNTLTAFGNGGGIIHQSVTSAANSMSPHIALADLPNRATVLTDLTTATDHLPIVADYSFASVIIPGDYDHNGVVDSTDYNIWQSAFGSTTTLDADGNHDGVVDAADYVVWRDNLGHSLSGSGAGSLATVPEPASWVLLLVGVSLAGMRKVASSSHLIER